MASKWLASFRQASGGDFEASTSVPKCQKRQKGSFDNSGILAGGKTKSDNPDPLLVEWREGVLQLGMIARPACIRAARWRQIVIDAGRFLPDWGTHASSLGWTTLDVFGAHPTHPVQRIDCAGLIVLLGGAEVVAITSDAVCTRNRTGATLSYHRRPLPDSVPLWELGLTPPTDAEATQRGARRDLACGQTGIRGNRYRQKQKSDQRGRRGRTAVLTQPLGRKPMRFKPERPPAGGRQNLKKPMPKHTRYRGESYEAWDIKNRYAEHMAKQRAAAAKRAPIGDRA